MIDSDGQALLDEFSTDREVTTVVVDSLSRVYAAALRSDPRYCVSGHIGLSAYKDFAGPGLGSLERFGGVWSKDDNLVRVYFAERYGKPVTIVAWRACRSGAGYDCGRRGPVAEALIEKNRARFGPHQLVLWQEPELTPVSADDVVIPLLHFNEGRHLRIEAALPTTIDRVWGRSRLAGLQGWVTLYEGDVDDGIITGPADLSPDGLPQSVPIVVVLQDADEPDETGDDVADEKAE